MQALKQSAPLKVHALLVSKAWAESENFDIDALVDKLGNIPGQMMDAVLQALPPKILRLSSDARAAELVEVSGAVKTRFVSPANVA